MAARAAYNGMNWPVFENSAKENANFLPGSAWGPGPKPISD